MSSYGISQFFCDYLFTVPVSFKYFATIYMLFLCCVVCYRAAICEKHFKEEDILTIGQSLRKRLKCGAVPCKNLPKSNVIYESKTRKPPCKRDLDQPIRHGKLSDVVSSYNKLSSATRGDFLCL